ncbi:MAG: outer membrane beta-barrel protein [Hyphomicrobiaceae bacterium]
MKRILGALALSGLSVLGAGVAQADGMIGPRVGSIKDGPVAHSGCGGRFTGGYVGVNAGLAKNMFKWDELFADYNDFQDKPLNTKDIGFTGGVQAGYNWQHCSGWVFGLEGDINAARAGFGERVHDSGQVGQVGTVTISNRLTSIATFRARLGKMINDTTFLYGTAGFAAGYINTNVIDDGHWGGAPPLSHLHKDWRTGYAVGGGFEHALNQIVSIKGEAMYLNFGSHTYHRNDGALPVPDVYVFKHSDTGWTARLGLNVKLGAPPVYHHAPVADVPPPPAKKAEAPCSTKASKASAACKPLK